MGLRGHVKFYTKGKYTETVYFPENDVCCMHCPFCRGRTGKRHVRHICIKSYEPLVDVGRTRGNDCPLIIIEKEEDGEYLREAITNTDGTESP